MSETLDCIDAGGIAPVALVVHALIADAGAQMSLIVPASGTEGMARTPGWLHLDVLGQELRPPTKKRNSASYSVVELV